MYDNDDYDANLESTLLAVQQANNEASDDYAAYLYHRATTPVMEVATTTDECPW